MILKSPSPPHQYFATSDWTCESLTPEAAWQAGLSTLRAQDEGKTRRLAWVIVNGKLESVPQDMPFTDGSENFEQWFDRVRATHEPGSQILFYAREIAHHDRALYEIVLSAIGGQAASFGLSRRGLDVEVFCGDYKITPGGVHREFCTNRHFVLAGKKFMHFWVGDAWIPEGIEREGSSGPLPGTEEEYLSSLAGTSADQSRTALTAEGGQVFTWANGVWHVGETAGLAFALNMASYMSSYDVDKAPFLLEKTEEGQVTLEWLSAYQSFLDMPTDDAIGKDNALAIASAFGILGADPPARSTAPPKKVLATTHAPILWCLSGDGVIVATHGRARRFSASVLPWLRTVGRLSVGDQCTVPNGTEHSQLASWLIVNSGLSEA